MPGTTVPPLVQFSGQVTDQTGKPRTGVVGVAFALYQDQEGGAPLWVETQNVQLDEQGHYTVLLGSQGAGLPLDLFNAGKARWLGAQVMLPGEVEQPRVILVAVPYALKAGDADTLGGIPASAFLTMQALQASGNPGGSLTSPAGPPLSTAASSISAAGITGGGTTNFIPLWTSSTNLGNSVLFQTGGNVGFSTKTPAGKLDVNGSAFVRGTFQLPALGTATAGGGFNSNPFDSLASSFNSKTNTAVSQDFRWQAEPVGNNTASPSGKLNLLFAAGTGTPAETGLSINNQGLFTFASGQTFPGTSSGTITGVTAGTDLTGGGNSGNVTLNVDTSKVITGVTAGTDLTGGGTGGSVTLNVDTTKVVTAVSAGTDLTGGGTGGSVTLNVDTTKVVTAVLPGADMLGGGTGGTVTLALDTTKVPQVAAANTFTADQTINGNLTLSGSINSGLVVQSNLTSPNVIGGFSGNSVSVGVIGATIGGGGSAGVGFTNSITANYGTVGGGSGNTASGIAATVAGGGGNTASGVQATVAGGVSNTASGTAATVAGGGGNTASGEDSFAGGFGAQATDSGSFVWCQTNGSNCGSIGTNSFVVSVLGKVQFYTNTGGTGCGIDTSGNLTCTGTINGSAKNFKVDDPADPANKYLVHSSVESSETMNIYTGNVVLDASGAATVELPSWFQAENADFRYLLTPIGAPGPNLYVAEEVTSNQFKIAGGKPGQKVSWQITAARQDAWAKAHPVEAEQDKPANERGLYLHPELYGQPNEKRIGWSADATPTKSH